MAAAVAAFATDIQSADAFASEVLRAQGVLQVVEAYCEWAGPCKAIVGTLRALSFSLGHVKFFTVNADRVPNTKALDAVRGKCQPAFFLFKDGVVQATVLGVQAPRLVQLITEAASGAKNTA